MIFYVQYGHMMGGSGLIGFLQIKGLEAEGHPGLKAVLGGLRDRLRYEETCQRYRHADGRYFVPSSVRTTGCRLATDNKRAGTAPFDELL